MKGTMSEMELSVFRQRSIEAMKQKAGRGELFLSRTRWAAHRYACGVALWRLRRSRRQNTG
jgi:hypothetical protein